jgi:hypothetical protein
VEVRVAGDSVEFAVRDLGAVHQRIEKDQDVVVPEQHVAHRVEVAVGVAVIGQG